MTRHPLILRAHLAREGFALDVDLRLPGHGVSALFGPSGSGKTTCLRVLAGLERDAQGLVSVDDQTWQDSARQLFVPVHRRAVGYVFQEASLLAHLSVAGNLRFGWQRTPPAQRRHGWDQGLDLLGIAHLLQRMPAELSGGERQRVAIARALATSPQVLLMDEPLAALDAQRKAEILPWLESLHRQLDIPVVYVTHSPDEVVRLADHLVLLEQGRPLAQGPVADLLARTDLPLSHGDHASTLIEARVQGHSPADQISVLGFDGGRILLPMLAQTLGKDTTVRLRIQARDVSLALQRPEHTSVLNILPATVTDIIPDGSGQVLVALQLAESEQTPPRPQAARLLSRISEFSARRLRLTTGQKVYAQIKGIAIVR